MGFVQVENSRTVRLLAAIFSLILKRSHLPPKRTKRLLKVRENLNFVKWRRCCNHLQSRDISKLETEECFISKLKSRNVNS